MAKLTVAIDDDVLKRAARRACEQGTSVDAVVREQLAAYAGFDDEMAARRRFVVGSHAHIGPSGFLRSIRCPGPVHRSQHPELSYCRP